MPIKRLFLGFLPLILVAGIFFYRPRMPGRVQGKPLPATKQMPEMAAVPPNIIDGAEHPELVPDLVAYRLFFITVALPEQATAPEKARQRAQLKVAGIKDDDVQRAASVLATFKVQYDYLVQHYNDSVDVANRSGRPPNLNKFLSEQDQLVQQTENALGGVLSPEGMTNFKGHVKQEKRNMRVAKEDR